MTAELKAWCVENKIQYTDLGLGRFETPIGVCVELNPPDGKCVSLKKHMSLNIDHHTNQLILSDSVQYIVFQFGSRFYYTSPDSLQLRKLVQFRYIGLCVRRFNFDITGVGALGVHGKYELMSGLHEYETWAEKAKFLRFSALGIAERGTLAGAIQFNEACKKHKIKPIIGLSIEILYNSHLIDLRLYAKTQQGWENLMTINSFNKVLHYQEISQYFEGVVVVYHPGAGVIDLLDTLTDTSDTYFQITTTGYRHSPRDLERLDCIKQYLRSYEGDVPPVVFNDMYCLEEDQEHLRKILVKQGGKKALLTKNHTFLSYDDIVAQLYEHFEDNDKELFKSVITISTANNRRLVDSVEFVLDSTGLKLPRYEMTEEEQSRFHTNEDLFKYLISEGLYKVAKYDPEIILERIKREGELIKRGDFIDYFLILWDMIQFCNREGIEVGPGRGSAAGSLISYLLGVTKINPLDYDLLFERFLNESRLQEEAPDIDIDYSSHRRDEVLKYMRDRYGFEYVCQVGTYGTLKLKSALKELNRYYHKLKPEEIGYLAKLFSDEQGAFIDIFKVISETSNKKLIDFVSQHYELLHDVESIIGSLKNSSIHACATIIAPKQQQKPIQKQIPIRVHEDGTLVSEWEGEELAKAGYLKEDVLATLQMTKIENMIRLIKEHHGVVIKTEEIPLDDERVFELFRQGYNQDVFHFGSSGLTTYLKHLQPENINDLVAAIALYRPGAMTSDAHMEYVKLKNKERDPIYDPLLQEVTEDTFGLYIYQEQIMKAVQIVGDFTLTEADGVRKAMGKKIAEKMESYSKQFIQSAINKGYDKEEAEKLWHKLEVFSAYGFNRAHAAAYSVIGYICNWFKVNYPFEFWITAFEYANEADIPEYLTEISQISDVKVSPPDINKSTNHFEYDINTKTLYWDLSKISHVGGQSVEMIILERERGGEFYSIDEFIHRIENFPIENYPQFKVNPVNKKVIENLIFAGAFDNLHNLQEDFSRYNLMYRYYTTRKEELPIVYSSNETSEHFWPIKQYEVCRFSRLDYKALVQSSQEFQSHLDDYIDGETFLSATSPRDVMVVGLLESFEIRRTKKGDNFALLRLLHNSIVINVRVWPQELSSEDERLLFPLHHSLTNSAYTGTLEHALPYYQNKIVILRGKLELPDQYKSFNEVVLSTYLRGSLIKFLK